MSPVHQRNSFSYSK